MLVDLSGKLSVPCAGSCLHDGVEFVESGLLPETNKELQCSSLERRAMPIPPFVDVGRLTTHRAEFILDQPEFEASLCKGPGGQVTRCVAVPSFARTSTAVLLNLDTLECHPIGFAGP